MADPIKPVRLLGSERLSSSVPAIGTIDIQTARGNVTADEVPGFSSLVFDYPNGKSIVILVYCPTQGRGSFTQMTAENARKAGASLLHLANLADGGGEAN